MRVTIDVDAERQQMIMRFPSCTLRFLIAPVIKDIKEIVRFEKGYVTFLASGIDGHNYLDLPEVCSWVDFKPNWSDITLEVINL